MKSLVIKACLSATLLVGPGGQAQNLAVEASRDFLQVRQKPSTNNELRSYFSDYVAYDTVFAIIFPPANCPRGEALINPIMQGLKKLRPDVPTVLISAYPESSAAQEYIGRYSFIADHYKYDEDEAYKGFLTFNAGYLHVPYLIKVVPSAGELLIGFNANNNDTDLLRDFCSYAQTMEKVEFGLSKSHKGDFQPSDSLLSVKQELVITCPDSITLSEIENQIEFYDDKLLFTDKLREAVEYFRISPRNPLLLEFQRELHTTPEQNRTFVEVADSLYSPMLADHDVRFISLSPRMLNDHTVAISYSLPKLWYISANSIGYKNKSSMLLVDLDADTSRVVPFATESEDFFYPHFSLFRYGDDIAIGCQRMTWPLGFDKEYYCDSPRFNPFDDRFYSYRQPIMAVFDSHNGQLKGHVGNLPHMSQTTRTGYYFTNPVLDSHNGRVAIADGFSGQISLYNMADTANAEYIEAFTIPSELVAAPDSTLFYSYDCATPYVGIFNRNFDDIKLCDDAIYCLIRYGIHGAYDATTDRYSVIRITLGSKDTEERSFNYTADGTPRFYGLRRKASGEIEPYTISHTPDGWILHLYEF